MTTSLVSSQEKLSSMASVSAQALHLRPLSLPTRSFSSSPLSVQSSCPPLTPLKPPPNSTSTIYAPKPARQVTRRRVVSKATVSDYNPSIADIFSDVSIFTAAGELVKFEDLWDQNEVRKCSSKIPSLTFSYWWKS